MSDRDCRSCAYHTVISSLDRCDNPRVYRMTDGFGPSCSFQRDPIGVHGTIQCGPEGTEWRERT